MTPAAPPVDWPLSDCLLTRGWSAAAPATLVWIRRHPLEPRYAAAVVRIDREGNTQVTELVDVGPAATWTAIEEARHDGPLERVDPARALQLLGHSAADSALFQDRPAPFATFSHRRAVDA